MIGIEEIASYIPAKRISNYERKNAFAIDNKFIEDKLGVKYISVKDEMEETSDLCVKAFENLQCKVNLDKKSVQALVVITQNPDTNLPHTSAIVHGKLDLPEQCACFDISLGCSGYVYGLSIVQSFMAENDLHRALLFTCDPYSKIINPEDKNTALIFGDAATVTLISDNPLYHSSKFIFGTLGKEHQNIVCKDGMLFMNGRAIFNFAAKYIPTDIQRIAELNGLQVDDIARFIFHQGSKYIIDTIIQRAKLKADRVAYDIYDYGNTVSSSIPIILEKEEKDAVNTNIMLSGFGVGLSWASVLLKRVK
jgi:3-oxoacyl-[acyl-carrier-protein] synthase-3